MEIKFYSTPVMEYLDCEIEGVLCESENEGSSGSYNPYDEEVIW